MGQSSSAPAQPPPRVVTTPLSAEPCCGCIPVPTLFGRTPLLRRNALVDGEFSPALEVANADVAADEEDAAVPGLVSSLAAASDLTWEDDGGGDEPAENDAGPAIEAPPTKKPLCRPVDLRSLPIAPPLPDELVSKIVAIDCGMVVILPPQRGGKKKSSKKKKKKKKKRDTEGAASKLVLRRVCILDGRGSPLLSETVRVPPPSATAAHPKGYKTKLARQISDHVLPRINGCGDDLNVGISPDEARARAAAIVVGKIVVGHSVDGDLDVLGLKDHPPDMVRDTSLYPPFLWDNGKKEKLCVLIGKRLGRDIQHPGKFHCSIEDALAALDLYKSVWRDWEESLSAATPTQKKAPSSVVASTRMVPSLLASTTEEGPAASSPGGSPKTHGMAAPIGDIGKVPTTSPSPKTSATAALEGRRKQRREYRKRKKSRTKLEQQERIARENSIPARVNSYSDIILSPAKFLISYSSVIVLSPIMFLSRVAQDTRQLVTDAVVLTFRAGRLRLGLQPSPKPFANQLYKRRKKRRMQWRARLLRAVYRVDSFFLLSHSLMELTKVTVIPWWAQTGQLLEMAASGEDSIDTVDRQAHWAAVATSMLGMSLLVATAQRRSLQSRICFLILAHYHCSLLFVSPSHGGGINLRIIKEHGKTAWSQVLSLRDNVSFWVDRRRYFERSLMPPHDIGDIMQSALHSDQLQQLYHVTYCLWFIFRCVVLNAPQANTRLINKEWRVWALGLVLILVALHRFNVFGVNNLPGMMAISGVLNSTHRLIHSSTF